MDEETPVDVVARSWREAKHWEWSENDAAKHHRKALDCMIQAAEEVVEHAKLNNLLRQEDINAEIELANAVQAKNSWYQVQKAGLNAEVLGRDLRDDNGVAKSDGGDVGGTWLQLMCCALLW